MTRFEFDKLRPDADREKALKRSLLRAIISAASDGTTLDPEDQEKLVQYKMGEITEDQMNLFFLAKAARVQEQQLFPQ